MSLARLFPSLFVRRILQLDLVAVCSISDSRSARAASSQRNINGDESVGGNIDENHFKNVKNRKWLESFKYCSNLRGNSQLNLEHNAIYQQTDRYEIDYTL